MAYSLITRDELPYLLDLHLFLSRPLRPAEVQSISDASSAAETPEADTSLYGSFPLVRQGRVCDPQLRCNWMAWESLDGNTGFGAYSWGAVK